VESFDEIKQSNRKKKKIPGEGTLRGDTKKGDDENGSPRKDGEDEENKS
jgi:hypothetical protein